jgi:hypothetical protein
LPALLTAADVPAVLASFRMQQDSYGQPIQINRMPSNAERALLQQRNAGLASALQRTDDEDGVKAALGRMFDGYPSLRNATNKSDLLDAYWVQLRGQPLIAVQVACERVEQNMVAEVSPEYPPTSPRMVELSRGLAGFLRAEQYQIDRILRASKLLPESLPDDPVKAQKIAAGLRALSQSLRSNIGSDNGKAGGFVSGLRR